MTANSKKINEIDIDMKTKAVFTKKGYEIQGQIGCGAFGQVKNARLFFYKFNNQPIFLSLFWF